MIMKPFCLTALIPTARSTNATTGTKTQLNATTITEKLQETKKFYTEFMIFGLRYENEFYLLLQTPNQSAEISFLLPNHPSQEPIFQSAFNGKGMYLTIEVEKVDEVYKQLKEKGIQMEIEIRDEP